jgi:hypothetical protein
MVKQSIKQLLRRDVALVSRCRVVSRSEPYVCTSSSDRIFNPLLSVHCHNYCKYSFLGYERVDLIPLSPSSTLKFQCTISTGVLILLTIFLVSLNKDLIQESR